MNNNKSENSDKQLTIKANNLTFKNELKNNLSDDFAFEHLFSNVQIVYEEPEIIYLLVPHQIKDLLKNSYFSSIERAIHNVYSKKMNIILITDIEELNALHALDLQNEENANKNQKETVKNIKTNIRENLKFENYAIGKFNSFTIKAAKNICESQKVEISPFFVHSDSGLGKTHLLHAMGNEYLKQGKTCLYINPDDLTRKLVEQLRNKNQDEINKIVDEIIAYDCVMFDDIQQYAHKENTLNVLFNILNHLINNNKQIIIAADKSPSELGGFEQRFITRFSGGIIVNINTLELEDVIEILKFKLRENDINPEYWENESLKFIARNFSTSIRSLEGAINRIKLFKQDDDFFTYDIATIKSIFQYVSQIKETITPDKIIEVVSKYYKIDKKKITSKTRKEEVVMARRIAMWIIKNYFDYSLEQIGKMFGAQSHSTVIVSVQWVDNNRKTNPTLKLALEKIDENLNKIL
ncbi:chromosomal replication initiator protein DnaA [Metamycoplasma hyosynoviae]|uniref:chromosomal replication initiator protein DnaA n=1 Tax=Metamycoplasma hyosynoviae TaxID=29559 RepID=UPI0023593E1B|nr:chromosomal replication initiator protein DnaA [Metamycoplasma hyosynoviae]MDC8937342.1 chromosomal replication initiator protein DnaA [Metamycoplasma hyosynoviae]